MSINWPVAMPRYELHVIKISVSPENRKIGFLNISQEPKVFPNLFPCVYRVYQNAAATKKVYSFLNKADICSIFYTVVHVVLF